MGIGFKELLIILAIALLIFGAKRLKTIGSDLGGAVKGFKKAMDDGRRQGEPAAQLAGPEGRGFRFDACSARPAASPTSEARADASSPDRFLQARCSKSASPRSS